MAEQGMSEQGMAGQGEAFFESRRFEQLSNTIFGVAMTLLAYGFPKDQFASGAPDWHSIAREYLPHFVAMVLGFVVAGMFWFSHQRRLAYAPRMSRPEVLTTLLLLLSIILLPATTGLYGAYWQAADIILLYACHLAIISLLNLALWWMAIAPGRDWHHIGAPAVAAAIFVLAAVAAVYAPQVARYAWSLTFIAPAIAAFIERRARRRRA
jgi:uncharacterized membrane protein